MAANKSSTVRAVGYARRSTDMQERSIPDQKAYVEKWAKEHGYEIVRWFIDDAISGTSTKGRNAFEQLITTAENGRDFQTILCYDISRFSRGGTNETGFYLHRLKVAGVDVVFTADGIPEGDEGELIQGVKSWQARQYSIKLARDSIRGQISNIKERKSAPGGMAPSGYDKQHLTSDGMVLRTLRWLPDGSKQEFGPDGKLLRVIESGVNIKKDKSDVIRYVLSTPERVTTMRRIYDLCVQGYGFHTIAETFNSEGIPSPGGIKWNLRLAPSGSQRQRGGPVCLQTGAAKPHGGNYRVDVVTMCVSTACGPQRLPATWATPRLTETPGKHRLVGFETSRCACGIRRWDSV